MEWVFEPVPRPALRVAHGEGRIPVRRIFCIGRNYRAHAREMGGDPDREPPFFFAKPPDAVLAAEPSVEAVLPYPPNTEELHHEVELGVIIGSRAKDVVDEASAMACVAGYVVAIDVTERDEQTAAKVKGMPWSVAKGYDSFLPLSEPFTLGDGEDWRSLRLWLDVNGERRQTCDAPA